MRAAVRRFHSPDVDLAAHVTTDDTDVEILVQVIAGPGDGPGEESFDIVVCTPGWLHRRAQQSGPVIGRHYLIVDRWDAGSVQEYLTGAFEREEADTWHELATRLGRIGKWEFEDYQE